MKAYDVADLANVGLKGSALVIELLVDHVSLDCEVIPKGSRGVVHAIRSSDMKALVFFPRELSGEKLAYRQGHMRLLERDEFKPVGRIG